jgi:hypothetical protein
MKLLKERFGEDFDPLALMAEQALALHEAAQESGDRQDRDSAINALEKVTKYVRPTLKQTEVDVSSSDGSMSPPAKVRLVAVYDDPEGRIAELEKDVDAIEERLTDEAIGSPVSDDPPQIGHG